ncbi:hypothetical protein Tco_0503539 [Tanacetum coccineum]
MGGARRRAYAIGGGKWGRQWMRCCVENGDGVVAAVVGCAKVVVCFGDGDEVGDGVGVRPMVAEEDGGDVVDVGFEWEVVRR